VGRSLKFSFFCDYISNFRSSQLGFLFVLQPNARDPSSSERPAIKPERPLQQKRLARETWLVVRFLSLFFSTADPIDRKQIDDHDRFMAMRYPLNLLLLFWGFWPLSRNMLKRTSPSWFLVERPSKRARETQLASGEIHEGPERPRSWTGLSHLAVKWVFLVQIPKGHKTEVSSEQIHHRQKPDANWASKTSRTAATGKTDTDTEIWSVFQRYLTFIFRLDIFVFYRFLLCALRQVDAITITALGINSSFARLTGRGGQVKKQSLITRGRASKGVTRNEELPLFSVQRGFRKARKQSQPVLGLRLWYLRRRYFPKQSIRLCSSFRVSIQYESLRQKRYQKNTEQSKPKRG